MGTWISVSRDEALVKSLASQLGMSGARRKAVGRQDYVASAVDLPLGPGHYVSVGPAPDGFELLHAESGRHVAVSATMLSLAKGGSGLGVWLEIAREDYVRIRDEISKGRTQKFVKKVPTGKFRMKKDGTTGGQIYRYYYKIDSGKGHIGDESHMKVGAMLAHGDGHFHVISEKGDKIRVRHDETKIEHILTRKQFRTMLEDHHRHEIHSLAQKRIEQTTRDYHAATQHGSKKQLQAAALARAKALSDLRAKKPFRYSQDVAPPSFFMVRLGRMGISLDAQGNRVLKRVPELEKMGFYRELQGWHKDEWPIAFLADNANRSPFRMSEKQLDKVREVSEILEFWWRGLTDAQRDRFALHYLSADGQRKWEKEWNNNPKKWEKWREVQDVRAGVVRSAVQGVAAPPAAPAPAATAPPKPAPLPAPPLASEKVPGPVPVRESFDSDSPFPFKSEAERESAFARGAVDRTRPTKSTDLGGSTVMSTRSMIVEIHRSKAQDIGGWRLIQVRHGETLTEKRTPRQWGGYDVQMLSRTRDDKQYTFSTDKPQSPAPPPRITVGADGARWETFAVSGGGFQAEGRSGHVPWDGDETFEQLFRRAAAEAGARQADVDQQWSASREAASRPVSASGRGEFVPCPPTEDLMRHPDFNPYKYEDERARENARIRRLSASRPIPRSVGLDELPASGV